MTAVDEGKKKKKKKKADVHNTRFSRCGIAAPHTECCHEQLQLSALILAPLHSHSPCSQLLYLVCLAELSAGSDPPIHNGRQNPHNVSKILAPPTSSPLIQSMLYVQTHNI